jgi:hypothetical protein
MAASCKLVALHCPAAHMPLSAVANAARCCSLQSACFAWPFAACRCQRVRKVSMQHLGFCAVSGRKSKGRSRGMCRPHMYCTATLSMLTIDRQAQLQP